MPFFSKLNCLANPKEPEGRRGLYPDAKPLEFNLDEPKTLVDRRLHPLLDIRDQKRSINLSFYELLYLREHPSERVNYNKRDSNQTEPDLEYIPDDELNQPVSPAGGIRYMHIRCAIFPQWKTCIYNKVDLIQEETSGIPSPLLGHPTDGSDGRDKSSSSSPPTTQVASEVVAASTSAIDALNANGIPRELADYLRPRSTTLSHDMARTSSASGEVADPASPADTPPPARSSPSPENVWTLSSSVHEPELASSLEPPVADAEIPSLTPITVRNVIEGIYNFVREPLDSDAWWDLQEMTRDLITTPAERRKRSPLDRRVRASEEARAHILADWLIDDVMFDGLVVTNVDGKGGMEVELLTRPPTTGELGWYHLMMRKRPHN